jgi:hypothetical protein
MRWFKFFPFDWRSAEKPVPSAPEKKRTWGPPKPPPRPPAPTRPVPMASADGDIDMLESNLDALYQRMNRYVRETKDADDIIAALGLPMEQGRIQGVHINVPRVLARIRALIDAKARSVAMQVALEQIRAGCDISHSLLTYAEIAAKADQALRLKTPWSEVRGK